MFAALTMQVVASVVMEVRMRLILALRVGEGGGRGWDGSVGGFGRGGGGRSFLGGGEVVMGVWVGLVGGMIFGGAGCVQGGLCDGIGRG